MKTSQQLRDALLCDEDSDEYNFKDDEDDKNMPNFGKKYDPR